MYGECVTCARRPPEPGVAARDRAVAQVGAAVTPDWNRRARQVVVQLAELGQEFTTDAVWARVPLVREPRAMGAVMAWAAAHGLVVATDRTVPSTRPECHARPIRVWAPATRRLLS